MKFTFVFALLFSWIYSFGQWVEKADYPGDARHHPITFSLNDVGYMLAGSSNSGDLDDMYKYDPVTDTWSQMPDFPGGARGFSYGVTSGNKAYVGFGSARINSTNVRLFDLWEFDGATETWRELTACECTGRQHPAMVATSQYIFVGLGADPDGNQNDWWRYEIATDTWEQRKNFPSKRRHHPFYFQIDDVPYVGFGHGDGIFNDLYSYDNETDSWTFRSFIRGGEARVAGTQFSHNGKGYVLSGDGSTHENLRTGEFWEFDPETDEFVEMPPHPGIGRWAPGSFLIGNTIYLIGGETDDLLNTVVAYELSPLSTDPEISSHIKVFPNPTSNRFTLTHQEEILDISLFDNLSRKIPIIVEGNSVSVVDKAPGLYHLQLRLKNGQLDTRTIVIQME